MTPGPSGPGVGPTATVLLRSVLAQSAVPAEVDTVRATGYSAAGSPLYGPEARDLSASVEWDGVPVAVTEFVLEYLADGRVVGLVQVDVRLSEGQTTTIENPTILLVSAALRSLTISPETVTIANGTSSSFQVVGQFADGTTQNLTSAATWTSTRPSVSTVDGGVARALAPGLTTIRASFGGQQAQANLTVSSAVVVGLRIAPGSPAIARGTSTTLAVSGVFSDGSTQPLSEGVSWTSSAATVASVEGGLVRGLAAGQATITASFSGQSVSAVVTVTDATLTDLEIQGGASTLALGTATEFRAVGTFSDMSTQDVSSQAVWNSTFPSVASVDRGRVQAVGEGSTSIQASFGGQSDEVSLQVEEAEITGLTVSAVGGASTVEVNGTVTLQAMATYTAGPPQDVTAMAIWNSSDDATVTVALAQTSWGRPRENGPLGSRRFRRYGGLGRAAIGRLEVPWLHVPRWGLGVRKSIPVGCEAFARQPGCRFNISPPEVSLCFPSTCFATAVWAFCSYSCSLRGAEGEAVAAMCPAPWAMLL